MRTVPVGGERGGGDLTQEAKIGLFTLLSGFGSIPFPLRSGIWVAVRGIS